MLALVLAFLSGCDPFYEVQGTDTIEAYEAYLREHPDSPERLQAEGRLATLYLERARTERTIESYDAFLERCPKSSYRKDALEERRDILWAWAEEQDTVAAWQRYVDDYDVPDREGGDRAGVKRAMRRLQVAQLRPDLEIGPVEMRPIRVDAPLDGYTFQADVTNVGEKPIEMLMLRLSYLDARGKPVGSAEWPLVDDHLPRNLPMEEGFDRPFAPGETRTWMWTTRDLPEGWVKTTKLAPTAIRIAGGGEMASTQL